MGYKTILHENGTLEKVENGAKPLTTATNPALGEGELAGLEQMDRGGLLSLVKRLPAKITGYALQTREERKDAMRLKIYDIAMSSENDAVTLKAANDWLDREEGKAIQRTAIGARVTMAGGVCPTCGSDPKLLFRSILESINGTSLGLPQIEDD
jgi:hypothetical protein